MAMPNPTILSDTTRFRPKHVRAHSRSPSRSPVRRAQFTAQHLDPLLRNLSPDSTLKALQATETIPLGPEQNVLTKSIADTTPAEREVGIRAAFAAQKLREWRSEIQQWSWPNRRETAFGAGFLPPAETASHVNAQGQHRVYLGCLPLNLVDQYEQRIDEIRDSLESLEMEDIKDHVLQAHSPASQPTPRVEVPEKHGGRKSYGRMRDFTALITATVIQALPDLATVTMLIETWNVRLTVLRDLPMLLAVLQAAKAGVHTATSTIRDPTQALLITREDFETTKQMLGDKVSDLGIRVDRMLDILDGHEDALPQSWIDALEKIELDYATWVVETQRVVSLNDSAARDGQFEEPQKHDVSEAAELEAREPSPQLGAEPLERELVMDAANALPPDQPKKDEQSSPVVPKPTLKLDTPAQHGHRRGISEVSAADSAYSAFSEISQAEIVEAMPTPVVPNPKVDLVDSPSRSDAAKPPMLQRASTASIEVINKDQLKRVDLRKSMSADLLAKMPHSPESTPTKALERLNGRPVSGTTPLAELEDPISAPMKDPTASSEGLPSPIVPVSPLAIRTKHVADPNTDVPVLPRKSSKRKSLGAATAISLSGESSMDVSDLVSPITPQDLEPPQSQIASVNQVEPGIAVVEGSLEAKIQDILQKLPTKIRLANSSDTTEPSSTSSTRASTPIPALTLSPAKPLRRSSTSGTDVRVFHLTQHGQSKQGAPIKLFVRTVGENGERVMVRVGGGWADLGEYLKEYSLHHGRRTVSEDKLEVAQYPGKQPMDSSTATALGRKARHGRGGSRSPSPPRIRKDEKVWTPPPVPAIPSSYSITSPKFTSISKPNGVIQTTIDEQTPPALNNAITSDNTPAIVRSATTSVPGVTTTTTVSVPQNPKSSSYTPLGAAGPMPAARRAATYGAAPPSNNERWVEDVVDKARAVSTNVVQGPTTTTTTKVVSSAPPRRASVLGLTPTAAKTPAQATTQKPTSKESKEPARRRSVLGVGNAPPADDNAPVRRKSILGLGEMGGIRRVFLRRKAEKK